MAVWPLPVMLVMVVPEIPLASLKQVRVESAVTVQVLEASRLRLAVLAVCAVLTAPVRAELFCSEHLRRDHAATSRHLTIAELLPATGGLASTR